VESGTCDGPCVGNENEKKNLEKKKTPFLREVVSGEQGHSSGIRSGAVIIDHTTASAGVARELFERCAVQGCGVFLNAPVSGGQAGRKMGQLTMHGRRWTSRYWNFSAGHDLLRNAQAEWGRLVRGQLTKMVNQICNRGVGAGSLARGIALWPRALA